MKWRSEGRLRAEWEQTATLAYLLAEPNRDPDKQPEPFTPDTFNPYANPKSQIPNPESDPPRRDGAEPYDPDLLKQIVASGNIR